MKEKSRVGKRYVSRSLMRNGSRNWEAEELREGRKRRLSWERS